MSSDVPLEATIDHVRGPGRVRRDVCTGLASGHVHSTPTLFIDGVIHRGDYAANTLLERLAS